MRAVVFALIGLLAGGFGGLSIANALQRANAYPHGVMTLLGRHLGGAREQATAVPCALQRATEHLDAVRVLARDVHPAFLTADSQDEVFARYAADLVRLSATPLPTDANCAQAVARVAEIGDACKACHRDYK